MRKLKITELNRISVEEFNGGFSFMAAFDTRSSTGIVRRRPRETISYRLV